MLEITKACVVFDEEELLELEQILIDEEEAEALKFLKKSVYDKIARSQQGKLKSHLDADGDPTQKFALGRTSGKPSDLEGEKGASQ